MGARTEAVRCRDGCERFTLPLRDFNQVEKVDDLPRELSTTGAPKGADPQVGDLAYYEPWGTLPPTTARARTTTA
ncbi:cyclophilin-like fold protein [Streptomyces sp. NPDC002817]|uniref:cyclophilin-like fold protein n=1 Tax=Streptomyces sp. NPDC088357 TaxID=3154655 RepID=UPI0034321E78